jgi:hypothetical protein
MELGKEIAKRISNEFTWQKSGEGEFPPQHSFCLPLEIKIKLTCNSGKYPDFTHGPSVCSESVQEKINFSFPCFFLFSLWYEQKSRSPTNKEVSLETETRFTNNLSEVQGRCKLLIIISENHNAIYLGSFIDYSKYVTTNSFYIFPNHSVIWRYVPK